MKARETALKLKRFEMDERARKVADLEQMIREFETIASDLDRQIQAEEDRTGVKDAKHFAYSTFAKSASQRRDNLRASIAGLRLKLDAAQQDFDEAQQQLSRAATEQPREISRTRRRHERPAGLALR
ncbi:flagellar export protein FliJ [Hyphomicrobium sp. LHD-15]|uniref:flagellar export protein FliJ n=1 Tax=Hyphomicrobium sp. LHD-15 TaxID=3072142 RepID=UPI00280D0665|nr:flagellar export protein FliJ [Hyphomicrobium sp. LHD-15]MDQ8700151.1 flagellar export protein FliJ [Hyphomicrobium sp. LHD-15]